MALQVQGGNIRGMQRCMSDDVWDEATMRQTASITASATFSHSASPDNVTWWHIMARQGAMQVYVKYVDHFCNHNSLYFHHL
jgi:hypothetical protein